jgi:uncharacterized membrane protein YuzA (DUF378 family)
MVGDWQNMSLGRAVLAVALGVVYFVFGLAGVFVFFLSDNVSFKRRWYRPYAILSSTLLVCVAIAMGFPRRLLALLIPAVVVITALNIRSTRFCGQCGKINGLSGFLLGPKFCAKCGAALEA